MPQNPWEQTYEKPKQDDVATISATHPTTMQRMGRKAVDWAQDNLSPGKSFHDVGRDAKQFGKMLLMGSSLVIPGAGEMVAPLAIAGEGAEGLEAAGEAGEEAGPIKAGVQKVAGKVRPMLDKAKQFFDTGSEEAVEGKGFQMKTIPEQPAGMGGKAINAAKAVGKMIVTHPKASAAIGAATAGAVGTGVGAYEMNKSGGTSQEPDKAPWEQNYQK